MEENREQPMTAQTEELNELCENEVSNSNGSQDLGKFKSVQALMDAYSSLQSEFTKKCQLLSQYQKDKTENAEDEQNNVKKADGPEEKGFDQEDFSRFLADNDRAGNYADEIKETFGQISTKQKSPYEVAWASVLMKHLKDGDKASDPIINEYVLSDENVRNKIIESYLQDITKSKPPLTLSSGMGESVAKVMPSQPQTLADAKAIVDKMFS